MRDRESQNCELRCHLRDHQHERPELLKIKAMPASATLTAKQAKFVAEYLIDGNRTRAAVAA